MAFPLIFVKLLFTKHFRFFIREDLHQILDGKIAEILKNEIGHNIPRQNVF